MCKKKIYKTYFTFPALFFYILLFIIPVILNFGYSFTNWNAIKMTGETAKFIGLDNFIDIFRDRDLLMVIIRTLLFAALTTVFKNVIGFLLALALNGITSLSVKPIRLITGLGFIVSLISFIGVIWAVIVSLLGHSVAGWASMVSIVCFIGGIQLLGIGIVGEYVGRIYLEAKRRPRFIVSERTFDEEDDER